MPVTGVNPSCPAGFGPNKPLGVSAGMKAIQGLGIDVDQDYDRAEGEAVYDIMQEYGVGNDEIAKYFQVDESGVADAADVIAQRYQTGADLGFGDKFTGDYTGDDVTRVYENLTSALTSS